ncbi:hypothetical protein [Kribbella sindirgiensis]|uniref:Uncharacterized protein n=1 Tax=Kribbella sindirgiensis TaxID=1124744 RepID=A0A4R0ILC7_9ACTN|nr:hypothetical protein [Kribbella sindirgiensis]TCC32106.1 hypothetical protein E0H50_17890 [Kribbella sindirgiensis]
MSKIWVFCGAVVVTIVAVVLVAIADVSLQEILSLFLGVLCLLWLILLLTVPWNLYFQAYALIHEIRTSRDRGIDVPDGREPEARRIASRMRWFAIGSHLVSAALVALITYLSDGAIGYYLAGLYLVSTFFRPAGAYFSYLRDRMSTMLQEVKHPRDDVIETMRRLDTVRTDLEGLHDTSDAQARRVTQLEQGLAAAEANAIARDRALHAKVDAHARQFEHSLTRLTDNQEVIAGLKAFLRLARSELS